MWAWGAVHDWIDQGISGSRVLCVLAGAGTGKSTISVAIWEKVNIETNLITFLVASLPHYFLLHLLQVLASRVKDGQMTVAMHFLKHNDQRRLEPIRIVKSLAFQLAKR